MPLANQTRHERHLRMTEKRIRATSAESAVKSMLDAALLPLAPPAHVVLRDGDQPFWEGVVRARARDEWQDADLVVAAQLARCQADLEKEQALLDAEGSILENAKGTKVMNPRVSVLEGLARREMALLRTLRMGGRVSGDARDDVLRRQIQRQNEKAAEDHEDDGLLAT